jgi:ketosteroid isomerase-like protein
MRVMFVGALLALSACASQTMKPDLAQARAQVEAAERAFARSMADRDLAAFSRLVSKDAIFFTGPTPLRGKDAVVAFWSRFFSAPAAPFSWAPDQVEVLASGDLALSTGPVHDPSGKLTNRFSSIWRQEAPGVWRIVFDRGEPASN